MDKRLLIDLLEDLTSSQNNNVQILNILIDRCCTASNLELTKFIDHLSCSLRQSPETFITAMKILVWYLHDDSLRTTRIRLPDFSSRLIIDVILPNINYSYILGFRELLRDCIEFLWWTVDDLDKWFARQTIMNLLDAILKINCVLEILITEDSDWNFFKRVLFDFEIIYFIEENKLSQLTEMAIKLVFDCHKHKKDWETLSKTYSYENKITFFKVC